MCVHIFWNLLLLQNAKPTLNIQRAITNQKEINELLNRKKLTNGILSPSINSDVSYNYKYEYIYTNGLYPFIYCCVTNLPKTKWLNTIIVSFFSIYKIENYVCGSHLWLALYLYWTVLIWITHIFNVQIFFKHWKDIAIFYIHSFCWRSFTITPKVWFVISTRSLVTGLLDVTSWKCFET